MSKVVVRCPTRVDLAGGTLDIWPIPHVLGAKATVNVAVSIDAKVKLELLPSQAGSTYTIKSWDQGVEIHGSYAEICNSPKLPLSALVIKEAWRADLPAFNLEISAKSPKGAGLGGSSSIAIAMLAAFQRMRNQFEEVGPFDERALVQTAGDIEARLIHTPTGVQDYWAAVRGGINILEFPFGRTNVVTLSAEKSGHLKESMILCYSGVSRQSAINNWEVFKRVFDKDPLTLRNLEQIGILAESCAKAIWDLDLEAALDCSAKEWQLRCEIWPNIETPETKRIDQAAKAHGAAFSRVCGAGGGGVMAVFCDPKSREAVSRSLVAAGGSILNAEVACEGLSFLE